jgi:hypothetical protein
VPAAQATHFNSELTMKLPRPALTDRHVHFLQLPCPATWITVVRHPVDFFISRFRLGAKAMCNIDKQRFQTKEM